MMKTNFVCLLLLFFLSLACSRGKRKAALSSPDSSIYLREDFSVSIDSLGGKVGLKIIDVAVDRNGSIYLADQSRYRIDIISSKGRYLGSIGQRGLGPGDFNHMKGIAIYKDILYVLENNPNRFSAFRLGNRHLIRMNPFPYVMVKKHRLGAPKLVYPLENGSFELVFPNYTISPNGGTPYNHVTFSVFNHNLEPVDKVVRSFPPSRYFHYTDPKNGGELIFGRLGKGLVHKTLVAFDAEGHLYEARSDSMHIRVFNSAGKKIRDILSPYLPPVFTENDLDSLVSKMQAHWQKKDFRVAIKQNHVDRWMAMQNLLIDDKGRCWVELVNPRKKKQTWWVFNTKGKLKWQFKLSKYVQLYVVRNHEAYGIWNKKGKYPKIVRYHVEGI